MLATRMICLLIGQRIAPLVRDFLASWSIDQILIVSVIVCLVLWCLISPAVRKSLANIFAVLAMGVGIGILSWAICSVALGEQIRSLGSLPILVSTLVDAIGLGAGLLAAGITALALSLGLRLGQRGEEIPHSAGVGIPRNHD